MYLYLLYKYTVYIYSTLILDSFIDYNYIADVESVTERGTYVTQLFIGKNVYKCWA